MFVSRQQSSRPNKSTPLAKKTETAPISYSFEKKWTIENKILIYRMAEKQEEVSRNSEVVTELPLEDLSPDKTDIKRQSVESDIVKSKDEEVAATPEKKTQSIS